MNISPTPSSAHNQPNSPADPTLVALLTLPGNAESPMRSTQADVRLKAKINAKVVVFILSPSVGSTSQRRPDYIRSLNLNMV